VRSKLQRNQKRYQRQHSLTSAVCIYACRRLALPGSPCELLNQHATQRREQIPMLIITKPQSVRQALGKNLQSLFPVQRGIPANFATALARLDLVTCRKRPPPRNDKLLSGYGLGKQVRNCRRVEGGPSVNCRSVKITEVRQVRRCVIVRGCARRAGVFVRQLTAKGRVHAGPPTPAYHPAVLDRRPEEPVIGFVASSGRTQ
jgi:hypothetical protein